MVEVDGEVASILAHSRLQGEFTFQPPGGTQEQCAANPKVSALKKSWICKILIYLLPFFLKSVVVIFLVSIRGVQNSQKIPLSMQPQSQMCNKTDSAHSYTHTPIYPLKHAYAHIHMQKVKQLPWSHNQTVESCWGTLNRKECSFLC